MPDTRMFYVDGRWVSPHTAHDFAVVDPSTEEICATISLGSDADADLAVAAAERAFEAWPRTESAERLRLVERLLKIDKRRVPDMAKAISTGMGAPIDMAQARQAGAGAFHIQNFIDALKASALPWATCRPWEAGPSGATAAGPGCCPQGRAARPRARWAG